MDKDLAASRSVPTSLPVSRGRQSDILSAPVTPLSSASPASPAPMWRCLKASASGIFSPVLCRPRAGSLKGSHSWVPQRKPFLGFSNFFFGPNQPQIWRISHLLHGSPNSIFLGDWFHVNQDRVLRMSLWMWRQVAPCRVLMDFDHTLESAWRMLAAWG